MSDARSGWEARLGHAILVRAGADNGAASLGSPARTLVALSRTNCYINVLENDLLRQSAEAVQAPVVPDEERVLTIAVARAADLWDLTNMTLGRIIGVSSATASRLRSGQKLLIRGTKPFELGQYFVRLFRSLDALTGSDDKSAVSWLNANNKDLGGRPIELITSVRGLAEVSNYVDDFRARV